MAVRIEDFERETEQKRGEYNRIKTTLESSKDRVSSLASLLEATLEAQRVIQAVAVATQSKIVFRINDIVNKVLQTVFPEYSFKLMYEVKHHKSEAALHFYCMDEEIDVFSDAGGVSDVVSIGLRFALWSLTNKANVMILDESLKFLSADLQSRGAEILELLSTTLGVQIMLISHIPAMTDRATTLIKVSKPGKYSKVTVGDS